MNKFLKKAKANAVVTAILCVLLGIVLLVWPGLSIQIVCLSIGIVLILCGGAKLIHYFRQKEGSLYDQMTLFIAIVFVVVGVWIAIKPEKVLSIIPIIVGIFITIHGINNLTQAITLCKGKYDRWWLALVMALITIGAGMFLVLRPIAVLDTVVKLIGVFLIYDGGSNLWIVSRISDNEKFNKKAERAVDVEIVDGEVVVDVPEKQE